MGEFVGCTTWIIFFFLAKNISYVYRYCQDIFGTKYFAKYRRLVFLFLQLLAIYTTKLLENEGEMMLQHEIEKVLELHELWLNGFPEGKRADLSGQDLSGQNLSSVDLSEAVLVGTDFTDALLDNACLYNVVATGANFTRASMKRSKLIDGRFENAVFAKSDLSFANLSCSDFTNANMQEAQLNHVHKRSAVGLPEDISYEEIWLNVNVTAKVMAPDRLTAVECLEYELKGGTFQFSQIENIYNVRMARS